MPITFFLLSAIGLFLSLWIVVPAPNLTLLTFGVGAPEISPWLVLLNAIALLLAVVQPKVSLLPQAALILSLLGLFLSCLPLSQIPATTARFEQEITQVLGTNYLDQIPLSLRAKMRPQPFVLRDTFRGIPLPEVRITKGIIFDTPETAELKLNLYQPLASGKYPAIVVLYGGAWQRGTASNDEAFSRYMAGQGYSVDRKSVV